MSKQTPEPQTLKLKIDRAALVKELNYVARVVPSNPTLPVLGCVLLEVQGDTLSLRTTNMDMTLTASVPAEIENSGAVCVGAKRFAKILGEMTDATVAIEVSDKHAVEITGAACKFKLLGMPDDDFPVSAKCAGEAVELKGSVLADAVAPVLHAVSTDETRFILNSVYLQLDADGEVHAVATDGRRLAKCGGTVGPKAVNAVVPTDAARLLVTLAEAEAVEVTIGSSNILVKAGDRTCCSKLVEGQYPNWKQVIPTDAPESVEMDSATLKAALHRVALVCGETVALTFAKGKLLIAGSQAEIGSGAESLKTDVSPREAITIAFDPRFLLDAITACGDTTTIKLTDGQSPMIITADRFLSVVMPKRVS